MIAKLVDHWLFLMQQLAVTLGETLLGVLFAIAIGVPMAMAIAYFKTLEQMIYPILIGVNSMPKVAIAPILVVWLGFGWTPKIVMVVLLSFFPIVLSTVSGLRSTPHELVDLARSLSATALQEFVKIRFRWALPQIFVGLEKRHHSRRHRRRHRRIRRRVVGSWVRDRPIRCECGHGSRVRRHDAPGGYEHRSVLPSRRPGEVASALG